MNHSRQHSAVQFLGAVALMLLLMAGCGRRGNTVRVTGQLVKDGKPFAAKLDGKEPETLAIDFLGAVNEVKVNFPATVSANGAFDVDGPSGNGIPPGKYRICVIYSGFQGAGGDRFDTRFSPDKTPLAVEVQKSTRLTIDLTAGTVSE
jgi:hypothetical protein